MRALAPLSLLAVGCGFHDYTLRDAAAELGPAPDLAGDDLAGGGDLAAQADASSGPGPLGALPTGFCCTRDEECRQRHCSTGGYCTDDCYDDRICTAWSPSFECNQITSLCTLRTGLPLQCLDSATYLGGSLPTGSCCDGQAQHVGQECLGGSCITSGSAANPYYCTQGCGPAEPCPDGFTCVDAANGLSDLRVCWFSSTINIQGVHTCR
jgi:hypothetical protein